MLYTTGTKTVTSLIMQKKENAYDFIVFCGKE